MDREDEIKEAQNRAYIEWFEKQQELAENDGYYENPPPYSPNPKFEPSHSEYYKMSPPVPVESKAKTFILELFGTLVAVGLIMIFMII